MSTLLASRTETANGSATVSTKAPADLDVATFLLSVTAAATESGDKLNVYVQSSRIVLAIAARSLRAIFNC